jgi:serine/threonine protein kinase
MIEIEYLKESDLDGFEIDLLKADKGSNEFCQYYDVTNKYDLQRYTIVAFTAEIPSNAKWVRTLMQEGLKEIIVPEKFGLVAFEEYEITLPVAIFKRLECDMTLASLVKQNGPLSIQVISEKLLPNLIRLLKFADSYNLAYGNINPENILISQDGDFIMRECYSGLDLQSKQRYYIAPELIDCKEFSLGRSSANDLYALGMTLYYAATGDSFWEKMSANEYNLLRLQSGTLPLLKKLKQLPLFWAQVISSLVINIGSRFDLESLLKKLDQSDSDRYSKLHSLSEQEIKIYFNNKKCTTFQVLAHELFCNWQTAMGFVQEDNIIKYLLTKNNSPNLESIDLVNLNPQDKLKALLQIIDPLGPIRDLGLAISLQAIPDSLTYAYISKDQESLAKIIKIISDWPNLIRYLAIEPNNDVNILLKNAASMYNSNDVMFGIERILYMTNKYLHCLSDVVFGNYVLTLEECLTILEQKLEQETFGLDNHLIAFLADRVGLESSLPQIKKFYGITESMSLKFMYLLTLAQHILPNVKIVNLCKHFVSDIIDILNENLYNLETKNKLQISLIKYAEDSQPDKIFNAVTDSKLYDQDSFGFAAACKKMQHLNQQIMELENKSLETENLLFYGQKVTVIFSYLIFLIISLVVIV